MKCVGEIVDDQNIPNTSDLARFSVLLALNANRLTGSLAGTGVRRSALAADWQVASMTQSTIAVDGLESLQISLKIAPEISLNEKTAGRDGLNQRVELFRRQISRLHVRVQMRLLNDAKRRCRAEAVNVREGCGKPLVAGNFDSK